MPIRLRKLIFGSPSRRRKGETAPPPPPSSPEPNVYPPIPAAFLCPVSSLIMFDPTIFDAGYSLDLPCLQACRDLNFTPAHLNLPPPPPPPSSSSTPPLPNINLKLAIQIWCQASSHPMPTPISPESALYLLRGLKSMPNPPPLPLRPRCFSVFPKEEQRILWDFQEDSLRGLFAVFKFRFCSPRILGAVLPLLNSREDHLHTAAAHAVKAMSYDPYNRTHILRSGAVSSLITILNTPRTNPNAWDSAAEALHKLALNAPYYCLLTIGALGAVEALLNKMCGNLVNESAKIHSGLALYHLSLHCRTNLEVLAEKGGVSKLVEMAEKERWQREAKKQALVLVNCLLGVERGREEVMDVGNINKLLKLVKEGEGVGLRSLHVMYNLCRENSGRFREVVVAAGGEVVLAEEMEHWGPEGKDMAIRMLRVISGDLNEGGQLDEIEIE